LIYFESGECERLANPSNERLELGTLLHFYLSTLMIARTAMMAVIDYVKPRRMMLVVKSFEFGSDFVYEVQHYNLNFELRTM